MDEIKLKYFLVNDTQSQIFSMDKDGSIGIIVNIIVDKCSTYEDESERVHKNINKYIYANNEAE